MKKKILLLLFVCAIAVSALSPSAVYADSGPKPSVRVSVENLGGELCYGTLLSKWESSGPQFAWDGTEEGKYLPSGLEEEIWSAFVNYEDADGYYFLQIAWLCSGERGISWTYYPPSSFKILLYFPERGEGGEFLVSGIYERYAFDSYYTVNLNKTDDGGLLIAQKSYDYTWEVVSLICRIVLTILLELGIALLFGFRSRRTLSVILVVNVITQVILNVLLNLINYSQGAFAFIGWYILLEFVVFAVEAVVYALAFRRFAEKKVPVWKSVLYALTANAFSFAGGILLARYIPGIF